MAPGSLDVDKRRRERTLKCRKQKGTDKYSVGQTFVQGVSEGPWLSSSKHGHEDPLSSQEVSEPPNPLEGCEPQDLTVRSGEGDDDEFAHLFRPDEEWHGVSGGKDDNLVEEGDEIGMNRIDCGFTRPDSYLTVNLSALKSKREIRKLKRRLTEELEQVRDVVKQLRDQRTPTPSPSYSSMGGDDRMRADDVAFRDENPMHDYSDVAQFHEQDELFASVTGRCGHKSAKRSRKAPELGKESDSVVIKNKIPISRNAGNPLARLIQSDYILQAFRSCKSLLMQLMEHNYGWIFNQPVDADMFNLCDYHTIIKHPMDLGTIKYKLTTNWYKSPMEFAEDVRLTFRNAMMYNPKGHEVHSMAEQLLEVFEKKWMLMKCTYDMADNIDTDTDLAALGNHVDLLAPGSDVELVTAGLDRISHPSSSSMRTSGTMESSCSETPANSASPGQEMVQQMPEVQINTPSMGMLDGLESSPGETPINNASQFQEVILEVPDIHRKTPSTRTENAMKANCTEMRVDCASLVQEFVPEIVRAHKDMTYEEKQKLNASIQDLPPIKLGGVVDIIKKKNSALFQSEDEVELDINFLDIETLRELEDYVLECNGCSGTTKRRPVDSYL